MKISVRIPTGIQYEMIDIEEIENIEKAIELLDKYSGCRKDNLKNKLTPVTWKNGDTFEQGNIKWTVVNDKWCFTETKKDDGTSESSKTDKRQNKGN